MIKVTKQQNKNPKAVIAMQFTYAAMHAGSFFGKLAAFNMKLFIQTTLLG